MKNDITDGAAKMRRRVACHCEAQVAGCSQEDLGHLDDGDGGNDGRAIERSTLHKPMDEDRRKVVAVCGRG